MWGRCFPMSNDVIDSVVGKKGPFMSRIASIYFLRVLVVPRIKAKRKHVVL